MPPNTQRLEQIMTMHAQHDDQLHRVVRYRGSHNPEVVDDACVHAWMKLLVAEDVDLRPPRWSALAWLTTCAVRHAWRLNGRSGVRQPPMSEVDTLVADRGQTAAGAERGD